MPTFTPEKRRRLASLAKELQVYGLVQYYERRQLEAQFELLEVRHFIGELSSTEYWMHYAVLTERGLRKYARFHDDQWRTESYYGELAVDKLRAATEGFDIDVADLQPADGQAELYAFGSLVE